MSSPFYHLYDDESTIPSKIEGETSVHCNESSPSTTSNCSDAMGERYDSLYGPKMNYSCRCLYVPIGDADR